MNSIGAVVLTAILSLTTQRSAPESRLERLADDIGLAAVLQESPFPGEAGKEAAALALVAIARTESDHFRARVLDCDESADGGRTFTAFGLMKGMAWYGASKEDLCPTGALAAFNALKVLRHHAARCKTTPRAWYYGYSSGDCGKKSDVGRNQCDTWVRLTREAGMVGASCDVVRPIEWAASEAQPGGRAPAPS